MRDLLTLLGIDKATVVGHSFGGGVAMQFAYQFPERTQRMMLVSPGGLGPEVTPLIKLIQAPGWERVMRVLTLPGIRHVETAALRALRRTAPGRRAVHPRPRGGGRHHRVLAGPGHPVRDPPPGACRRSTGAARSSPWPTGPT